jgi:carboxymethylenebutenolidase
MERKKASDFPQELLNLFDGYVHGGISRRQFLDGAQKFAVGGVTAAALLQMLKPNYAWAIQGWPTSSARHAARSTREPNPRHIEKLMRGVGGRSDRLGVVAFTR